MLFYSVNSYTRTTGKWICYRFIYCLLFLTHTHTHMHNIQMSTTQVTFCNSIEKRLFIAREDPPVLCKLSQYGTCVILTLWIVIIQSSVLFKHLWSKRIWFFWWVWPGSRFLGSFKELLIFQGKGKKKKKQDQKNPQQIMETGFCPIACPSSGKSF